MAEVFATVASGAGLASLGLQLVDCAVKLKAFYETVEKAPKTLDRISREIKTFALLLRQIDDTRARHGIEDSEVLQESIEICTECTHEIVEFTSRLEAMMRRYHLAGRVYSALRLSDVREICGELERAKNSLMMAFQVFDHRTQVRMMEVSRDLTMQQSLVLLRHSEAIAQIQHDTARLLESSSSRHHGRLLTNHKESYAEGDDNVEIIPRTCNEESGSGLMVTSNDIGKTYRHRHRNTHRFRVPFWFSNKIWEITAFRSLGRWGLCLNTYNQRPEKDPIVAHYLTGNVKAVGELYRSGQASPNDVYGNATPLILATYSGSLDMLKFLQGFDFNDSHHTLESTLDILNIMCYPHTQDSDYTAAGEAFHMLYSMKQRLLQDNRLDVEEMYYDRWQRRNLHFLSADEILGLFENPSIASTKSWTLSQQVTFLESSYTFSTPMDFRILEQLTHIDKSLGRSNLERLSGVNPLHILASSLAGLLYRCLRWDPADHSFAFNATHSSWKTACELETIFKKWIRLGFNLHAADNSRATPLQRFLTCANRFGEDGGDNQYQILLDCWISCLLDAGVDLIDYGKRESMHWDRDYVLARQPGGCSGRIHIVTTGFEYGPTIDDWHLFMNRELRLALYNLAGIPGGWPRSPYHIQTICWPPEEKHTSPDSGWRYDRVIIIAMKAFGRMVVGDVTEYVRLLQGPQDDNLAAARFLLAEGCSGNSRSRRRSLPQIPILLQEPTSSFIHTSSSCQKPWLTEYVYRCPGCRSLLFGSHGPCHILHHVLGDCERSRHNASLKLHDLGRWKRFVDEYGCMPVICGPFTAGSFFISSLESYTVTAMDIFGTLYDEHLFCEEFPTCLHQRPYLLSESNRLMGT